MRWPWTIVGLCVVGLGCPSDSRFQCAQDVQCGADGFCELDGNCSFADDTCPSGRRYGDHGSQGLAGTCVQVFDTEGASTTTSAGVEDTGSPGPTTESPLDDSGSTSTTTANTSDEPPATGSDDGSTGEPVTPTTFFDDFERPDGPDLGNDWWEKTPAALSLQGGRVVKTTEVASYPDSLVLRPEDETFADLESQIVFVPNVAALGYPQLHLRVQPDSELAGTVTAYILYCVDGNLLEITRQEASSFAFQESMPLSEALIPATPYRLRMRIEGEDPVLIDGYLEIEDANGEWSVHTEVHMVDTDATRISTPGRVGFSADVPEPTYVYDDFGYTLDGP